MTDAPGAAEGTGGVRPGAVVIGYDGSPAADRAITEAATLLVSRRALVVVVWEPAVVLPPVSDMSLAPAPIDMRSAHEVDEATSEHARRLAEQGAARARDAGMAAEGLAVADEMSVADTLLRLAREQEAPALVVGAHGHRRVRELLLGSTTRDLIRHGPCPVVVVRGPEGGDE